MELKKKCKLFYLVETLDPHMTGKICCISILEFKRKKGNRSLLRYKEK